MFGGCVAAIAIVAAVQSNHIKTAIDVYRKDGLNGVYRRTQAYLGIPNVHWETCTPEEVGLSTDRLEKLRASLIAQGTESLLIARNGCIAFEWYAKNFGPSYLVPLAGAAKGTVGSVILLTALSDDKIGLDDRIAEYVPAWKDDPQKSKITVRQLASYSSGIDDVELSFTVKHSGWKEEYFRNENRRFDMALKQAPILFEPGSQFSYSGVGYYALAYALGTVLKNSPEPTDLKSYLRDRIMNPLGIPSDAWMISYGHVYPVDGMSLYAIGSGASYTTRAAARTGELFLEDGKWNGRQLIESKWIHQALSYANSPPHMVAGGTDPPAGLGWWVNAGNFFPALPQDAAVTAGNGRIMLVVPSLRLVVVRLGEALGQLGDDSWQATEKELFEPLMDSFN
jgi:CubicO group peptidase (beta-lactamase class C family)